MRDTQLDAKLVGGAVLNFIEFALVWLNPLPLFILACEKL
jgi:hypothetical protein